MTTIDVRIEDIATDKMIDETIISRIIEGIITEVIIGKLWKRQSTEI